MAPKTRPHRVAPHPPAALVFRPVTADRWTDFETLFGARGACGGCWCMWWRLTRREFDAGKGDANREAMRALVASGAEPGLLAYEGAEPVGWAAVAPRSAFRRLEATRTLQPVDDKAAWAVVCFFVRKDRRRSGVALGLLKAAGDFARERGAPALEGYPSPDPSGTLPAPFLYTGTVSLFERAGFAMAARRGKGRAVMRLDL
jgi:GNAT superfamily N-acetyltransferase